MNESVLSKTFNLSSVDFNKCDEFASKNIIKEICMYYEYHKPMLSRDLSKKFNIGVSTLNSYLHKGNKLGWCNYDPKESHRYGSAYSGIRTTKKADIYKNDKLMISYDSLKEMEEKSFNDLGVKLLAARASKASKENKLYKGYKIIVYPKNSHEVIKE